MRRRRRPPRVAPLRASLRTRWIVTCAVAAVVVGAARSALAAPPTARRIDVGGRVRAVRLADVDGDGRPDVVAIVSPRDAPDASEVVVLRSAARPDPTTWFAASAIERIPCSGPRAGPRARAGAVAVGRFSPTGPDTGTFEDRAARPASLRFFAPEGVFDQAPRADATPADRAFGPTMLGRSAGEPLVFWDAVADLDGHGGDVAWWPGADGVLRLEGTATPVSVSEWAKTSDTDLFAGTSRVPTLLPVDVDGDGVRETLSLEGGSLVVHRRVRGALERVAAVALPFLAPEPERPANEIRTPRLSLADVDGDGKTDLLVTLVHGRTDQLGGLRTSLYLYRGPFLDLRKGTLAAPRPRIDTESVALHPRFTDVDGDGRLDYVADSVRGTLIDVVRNMTGRDPTITYTVFRYDAAAEGFERAPFATLARTYSAEEANGNTFGRTGWFDGDFDGDGVRDLLDLGNLRRVEVLRGAKDKGGFETPLGPALAFDPPLAPEAAIADLDGDGRAEAVLRDGEALIVLSTRDVEARR